LVKKVAGSLVMMAFAADLSGIVVVTSDTSGVDDDEDDDVDETDEPTRSKPGPMLMRTRSVVDFLRRRGGGLKSTYNSNCFRIGDLLFWRVRRRDAARI